jgi:RNA-directed DNA polymerase
MNLFLDKSPEYLRQQFYQLLHPEDVASLLEVDYQSLIYYIYRTPDEAKYFVFTIAKKSGGFREISAPNPSLKILQKKLSQVLNSVYQPATATHGFVSSKSIVTNASTHTQRRKKYVLNLDIKDFFPSINFGRVRGLFLSSPYNLPDDVATVLAQISCYNNMLPQGSPTSPIISNMICRSMDSQLLQLAKKHRATYTRYADDITFSTSLPNFPTSLATSSGIDIEIGNELSDVIQNNGFEINRSKIRLQIRTHKQEVTGLTVNQFPNLPRKFVRQIRAILHAWEKFGLSNAANEYVDKYKKGNPYRFSVKNNEQVFLSTIRGKIEFVGMVRGKHDALYVKFLNKFNELLNKVQESQLTSDSEPVVINQVESSIALVGDQKDFKQDKKHVSPQAQIFISYSRQDEEFVRKLGRTLQEVGANIWLDTSSIRVGDDWDNAVQKGLEESEVMLLIATPTSMKSQNVTDEWAFFKDKGKLIVVVMLKHCELHFRLKRIQWIDFDVENYDESLARLYWELKSRGLQLNV